MKYPLVASALLTAMLTSSVSDAHDAKPPQDREKCYGVAKAGKNDCSAKDGSNGCARLAKKDADPNQWVFVPKGLCSKLVGGVEG